MYAVIETGGKQYRVEVGDTLDVEMLPVAVGSSYEFPKVLLYSDGETQLVGKPYLENVSVRGVIKREFRARKVIAFKYRRREGWHVKKGHRQNLHEVKVEEIKLKS